MSSTSVHRHQRGLDRQIRDRMTIYRDGRSERLAALCGKLASYRKDFPDLEVRDSLRLKRVPTVFLLERNEVAQNSGSLGHLVLSKVINKVFDNVPSLATPQKIMLTNVIAPKDLSGRRSEHLVIGMADTYEERLLEERRGIMDTLVEMSGRPLNIGGKTLGLTVAFIPFSASGASSSLITEVEKALPFEVNLSPAKY